MGELRKQIREVTGNKSKGKGAYSGRNEQRAGKIKEEDLRKMWGYLEGKKHEIRDKLGSTEINTLRTGDADLRLYITTVQDG